MHYKKCNLLYNRFVWRTDQNRQFSLSASNNQINMHWDCDEKKNLFLNHLFEMIYLIQFIEPV